ncbi:GNAT family N-acetyltransferase [Streptomyces sp. R28]|uniref:GNAT family N-acetyltransferase n=1 Tax=Streptomyces sp. R28 TaxID=3238628 RepID=A0AB39PS10_9ACTN
MSDAQWERLEPLLPPIPRMGRPPRDRRHVFDGIWWRARTGSPGRNCHLAVDTSSADSVEAVGGWSEGWRKDWEEERPAQWAFVDVNTGRLLGRVALRETRLDEGTAEVAYCTTVEARGKGVAARVTTALARWALDDIGFHCLDLLHAARHEASCTHACRTTDRTGQPAPS